MRLHGYPREGGYRTRDHKDDHRGGAEQVPDGWVIKDVVMLGGFQELEFDFVADNPV